MAFDVRRRNGDAVGFVRQRSRPLLAAHVEFMCSRSLLRDFMQDAPIHLFRHGNVQEVGDGWREIRARGRNVTPHASLDVGSEGDEQGGWIALIMKVGLSESVVRLTNSAH